jgi:metallophosphoesterase superfamily enzyme
VVADLHWGYAASHRARGNLLPVWGDEEIETRLTSLVRDYAPREMLWLGDIVHAAEGAARAERFLRNSTVPVTLIAGNHDRRWRGIYGAAVFPVRHAQGPEPVERQPPTYCVQRGSYFFHHGDRPHEIGPGMIEIIGHHHPAISWGDNAGSRVKLRALIARPNRIILPAFSPWAAGTPWNDLLTAEDQPWVIAPNRIFALPRSPRISTAIA